MIKQKISTIWGKILVAGVGIISSGSAVFAQTQEDTGPTTTSFDVTKYLQADGQNLKNVIGPDKNPIGSFIIRGVNFLSLMIGSFAFLAIVIGGIMLLTSAGDQNRTTKGKDMIKYAIMGLLVSMLAYFITAITQSIFYEYGTATTSP